MRRIALIVVLVACTSATLGIVTAMASSPPDIAPNVRGVVLRAPISPVCREGQACDAPAKSLGLVFARAGVDVARATTGRDGRFALRLAPGSYTVRTARRIPLGGLKPRLFKVVTGRVTTLKLVLDTGIRTPSPGASLAQ